MRQRHRQRLSALAYAALAAVALAGWAKAEDPPQPLAASVLADELAMTSLMEVGGHVPGALRVLDLRSPEQWRTGHVPGAVNLPVGSKSRRQLLSRLRALGIGEGARVVLYGRVTAEIYHALDGLGAGSVAVLDGGIAAWRAGGYPLTTAPAS